MRSEKTDREENNLWTEDVIPQKILDSAKDISIPESLEPEQIRKRLQEKQTKGRVTAIRRLTELAATAALVIAIGSIGIHYWGTQDKSFRDDTLQGGNNALGMADTGKETDIQENVPLRYAHSASAGEKYYLADDYRDIYETVESVRWEAEYSVEDSIGMAANEMPESLQDKNTGSEGALPSENMVSTESQDSHKEYSRTNLQTRGVDESDVVKTDGDYIYVVSDGQIEIIGLASGKMEQVGNIRPSLDSGDTVREMYVDGNQLYLIIEKLETELKLESSDLTGDSAKRYGTGAYYMDTDSYTQLQTYDISDRSKPRLVGRVTQEGYYNTSRKVGNYIYMFTGKGVEYYTNLEEFVDNAIPTVQGEKLTPCDIYIPERASHQLVVASVDVRKPDKTVDQIAVFNENTQIYVGGSSIYLYNDAWENGEEYTEIARFSYKDGYMDAKAATSVKGTVQDTFAINEKGSSLRVLTSGWGDGDSVNRLYLLDESLKITGQIDGIAVGEEVYAARYLGDMAYFITYRNTDPLFVADLSDASNPKLLGSVEVTGFSDYLHFYGENLLLGIGYETDEESTRKGVKLCMFDIADGANPKVIGTKVMAEADYTIAAHDYKCVLVSPEKNLIGFLVEDYDNEENRENYKVFQWQADHFEEILSQSLNQEELLPGKGSMVRGLYIGDCFYLVGDKKIQSYDMKNSFALLEELLYTK